MGGGGGRSLSPWRADKDTTEFRVSKRPRTLCHEEEEEELRVGMGGKEEMTVITTLWLSYFWYAAFVVCHYFIRLVGYFPERSVNGHTVVIIISTTFQGARLLG